MGSFQQAVIKALITITIIPKSPWCGCWRDGCWGGGDAAAFVSLGYSSVALQKAGKSFAHRGAGLLLQPAAAAAAAAKEGGTAPAFCVGTLQTPCMNHNSGQAAACIASCALERGFSCIVGSADLLLLLLGMRETRPHLNNILNFFFSFLYEFLEALISVNGISE